jgi:uncharacterized protein (DUF1810 family)
VADVTRFADGYDRDVERALGEINAGRKRSHWMWYLFPQFYGLGSSSTAQHYAIADRAEAEAFLTDPRLGPAYGRLVDAVWHQVVNNGISVRDLFGRPDDQKLVSSLTLFATVATGLAPTAALTTLIARANAVLDVAATQGLPRCALTTSNLAR